ERSLARIAEVVAELAPDVLLLQEVDRGSDRSCGVDQAALIARKAGLLHLARAPSWDVDYLPFPYWPPSRHYGRLLSGGAILSRHPIADCRVEILDKP